MESYRPQMSDGIKSASNQVFQSANGGWRALFRGQTVYTVTGTVREFSSKDEAAAFLRRCDAAGRIID